MPAGAVKKIKFVNKNTVDEYVRPEHKLLAWGGSDPWEYEFVEESVTPPETDEVDTMINGNGNEISTSEVCGCQFCWSQTYLIFTKEVPGSL